MATGNTTLLGLALPVEGELDGTWGDVVNDSITSLVDSAIAGTTTLSADADVTLTTTNLAANQARQAVLLWTASNGATTRNITAPARSKPYIVINAGTGSIVLRGAGPTTGITVVAGEKCLAAWNGSDFVKVATSTSAPGDVTLNGTQTLTNKTIAYASNTLTGVQPTLVSGTSIKTINNESLLGSGNIAVGSSIIRVERTSNTELAAANSSNLIDITSGTFTQTFAAAATLGDGWYVYIENSGTGNITLDPSSSETIDGLTSFIMYPGEVRLIQCDGTALRSIVLNSFFATFTTTGTFTKPPGYSYFSGLLWGGGGGGGRTGDGSRAAGHGGGGACVPFNVPSASVGTSVTVTIGAGGSGISSPTVSQGGQGGTSSFGTIVSSYGGGGGGASGSANSGSGGGGGALSAGTTGPNGATTSAAGGLPNYATSVSIQNSGFGGGGGAGTSTGGDSAYGGGGGNSGDSIYGGGGGNGGTSVFGGAGGGTATAGTAPAGGGGGAALQASSGAGARGEARIWGII
jgi:hypothetical protein